MEDKKYIFFDIESAELVDENPDSRFMTVKVQAFSSGRNLHNMICSEDTLKKTASTIYDAPIIYNIVKSKNDFGTHTSAEDSLICGFCVPNTAEFVELEDGRVGLFVQARISKRYAPDVVDILKRRDGNSKVSVEMELVASHILDDGYEEMDDFIYFAVCLLGVQYQEASPLAHLKVLSFAEENAVYQKEYLMEFSNKYADIDFTIPKEVKASAKKSLDNYKEKGIGATSMSLAVGRFLVNNDSATPEKIRAISKFFNRKVQYDEITIGFFGGKKGAIWSKEIMDKINEIDEKRLSYFEEDEIITFPYKSIDKAPENMKKLDGVALTLGQINEIANVADAIGVNKEKNGYAIAKSQFKKGHHVEKGHWVKNKSEKKEEYSVRILKTKEIADAEIKFSLNSSQITEILNNSLSGFKYGKDNEWNKYWVYSFDSEYAYFHDSEDNKSFRAKYSIVELKAAVDIEGKEEVIQGSPLPVEEKEYLPEFAEEESEDKPKDEPEKDEPEGEPEEGDNPKEKDMSLDSNLDMAALLAMLAEETDDYKALVAKHESGEEMDYAVLCSKMYCKMQTMAEDAKKDKDTYMAENMALKEYKDKIEKQQFDYATEKTLQEVSDIFSKDEIEDFRKEVESFSLDTLPAWQNSIRSLAFSHIKDNPKKKESFTRMATVNSWLSKNSNFEDPTEEYAKNGWL